MSTESPPFKPGLYRHHSGGLYNAFMVVAHHHTRQDMVVYCSLKFAGNNTRNLERLPGQIGEEWDAWNEMVEVPARPSMSANAPDEMKKVRRFTYVGELPSDTPAAER